MKRKLLCLFLAVLSVFMLCLPTLAADEKAGTAAPTELYLHVGSPVALSGGKIVKLDSTNPDVAPVIVQSRTLVPLRAISEHFDAKVDWDNTSRTAKIILPDGKTAAFKIDEKAFTLEGKKIELDVGASLMNGRTMVPLRAIGEQIFGLNVDYTDGLISLTTAASPLKDAAFVEKTNDKIATALKVGSRDALLAMVEQSKRGVYGDVDKVAMPTETNGLADAATGSADAAMPAEAPAMEGERGDGGYSSTNVQVEGIDEGDIVKTDGKYIYIMSGRLVKIYSADNGKLSFISEVVIGETESSYGNEMYISEGRVVVIGGRYQSIENASDMAMTKIWRPSKYFTFVSVFDVSDIKAPSLFKTFEIEGYYTSSRKQDDVVYLVSNYSAYEGVIPLICDTSVSVEAKELPISDIMYICGQPAESYLNVAAVDIRDQDRATEIESILGGGYETYMNANALYIASSTWLEDKTATKIIKFAVDGNLISYAGSGVVDGYTYSQFSFDEYEGYLRVATTEWDKGNNLFVLDDSLNIVGSVRDLAKGESIYSVRFMGKRGYIVTYRRVDPLFVLDLSDPTSPRVTGELKIPGFSNYLHPVSENLIVGVGYDSYDIYKKDAKGNDVVVGQQVGGIKISLFDVSDAGKPVEIKNLVLGESGSYAEVMYNHKALMYRAADGLLAFDAQLSLTANRSAAELDYFDGALLIHAGTDGLYEVGRIAGPEFVPVKDEAGEYFYFGYGSRLLYIGNTLYYIKNNQLVSYSLASRSMIDKVNLSER